MRTLLGRTPVVLARRWLALERLAAITLRRDAYAEPPGPTLGLSIGERTVYRPAAWLLDPFERAALGGAYGAWGGSAGLTLASPGRVVPVVVGPPGMAAHTRTLPRDPWAAVVIGALDGDAAVGVLTRAAADTGDGYRITATPTHTVVERLDAGVATSLADALTSWRPGETLRVVWHWDRCRVYRDAIMVIELSEAARITDGRAGLVVMRGDESADAAIASFVAGAARHEYLGAGLDLGDVQRVIGQPASFDLTLSNLAPMGDKASFAALLRHGLNAGPGTYDLDRGLVHVLTIVDGAPAPLTAGVGLIDGPAEVAEDRVRLIVRGRDAFLTPKIRPGVVTYLAGPPPGGLTPLPTDPCEPAAPPVIVVGPIPPEPVDPPADAGTGPEAPPEPPATPPAPELHGAYLVNVLGPSDPPGGDNWVNPILDAEYLAALGVGLDVPTNANNGVVAYDIQTACLQRGSVSTQANYSGWHDDNYKTQAVLYRHPATMPGTRMRIAVRGAARINCDVGGIAAEWALGHGNRGGVLNAGLGAVGTFQGQTTQATTVGAPHTPAAWNATALDGAPKLVRYADDFATIADLERLRQVGPDRPTIVDVLDAVPAPAPEAPLVSGICQANPAFHTWPTWEFYEFDLGGAKLIGIEWGVTEVEDPVTHEITLVPVDRDAPALLTVADYPPSIWSDSGLYAQVFIVRVWTPEE